MSGISVFDSLQDYFSIIEEGIKSFLQTYDDPRTYYHMLEYHFGYRDTRLAEVSAADNNQPRKGKRIRPLMCLLVYQALTGRHREAIPLIVAWELMHNASLVHDDIQDGDEVRWKRPTLWKLFGTAQGINGGDTLIGLTYSSVLELAKSGFSYETVHKILAIINHTHLQMAEGQYLDISFESRPEVRITEYFEMISKKTASPFDGIGHSAAVLAGGSDDVILRFKWFGRKLGMLFQVTDDVLGIWGDPQQTGKKPLGDILRRKKTLPVLYALDLASPEQREILKQHYSLSAEAKDNGLVQTVVDILDLLNVKEYCIQWVDKFRDETIASLEKTGIRGSPWDILRGIVDYCYVRVR